MNIEFIPYEEEYTFIQKLDLIAGVLILYVAISVTGITFKNKDE